MRDLVLMTLFHLIKHLGCHTKVLWSYLPDIFNIVLGSDYESMARWWVSNTKHKIMNGFSAALMWSLWKFRNEMCFQGRIWTGEKTLIRRMLNTLKNWRSLYPEEDATKLDQALSRLAAKLEAPLQLLPPHGAQQQHQQYQDRLPKR